MKIQISDEFIERISQPSDLDEIDVPPTGTRHLSEETRSIQPLKKLAKKYKALIAPNPEGHDLDAIEKAGFEILDWVKENL